MKKSSLAAALVLLALHAAPLSAAPDAAALYQQHCAECHGKDRLGLTGPALLPENLVRVKKDAAKETIRNGLEATQMPAFREKLAAEEVDALADLVYTPLVQMPVWGQAQIEASQVLTPAVKATDKPLWSADPLNLFVVVEAGDHSVSILDGDRFEPLHRFKSRYALHGGPKFTSDGRYVFFGSRDGWISKLDLYTLTVVAEVRAGINMRNVAVSADNRYVIAANYLPHTLVLFDAADLKLLKVIPVASGGRTSRVSAVYTAKPRQSFVAALKDIKEVWEIPYGDNPAWSGSRHDWRDDADDKEWQQGTFPIRRIPLDDYLDDFFFDSNYEHLMGASRGADEKAQKGQVIDLTIGKKIAELDLPGMPHLGSGITFEREGRRVMATPDLKSGALSVFDLTDWKLIGKIPMDGPGFFIRSHEASPYAWAGPFFGPNRDKMHIIDKRTLAIVKTLQPAPGKTFDHVEFTRDGSHALVSLMEKQGALYVYDARSFELVKTIPMSKPIGKYNVFNKINLSEGTSH